MMFVGLMMASAFALTTGILLHAIPDPRKSTDYLVIGTIGTFAAMGTLFVMAYIGGKKK
jgi:hypothetical protein